MNIHDLHPDKVMFAGDWHGYLGQAVAALDLAQQHDIKVIVQLGDFGFWNDHASNRFLKGLSLQLQARDQVLYFVDGNHEEFPYLYSYPLLEDGTRKVRERIYHLPRGLRFTWQGVQFLAMGGAYSVDRAHRSADQWFPEEEVSFDTIAAAINDGPTDVILMHDSPAGAPNDVTDNPLNQHRAARFFGADHIAAAGAHREILRPLLTLDPVLIMHGHYHDHWVKPYYLPSGQQSTIICLDEGSHGPSRNTITSTLAALQTMKNTYRNEENID